jgi:hypothetical protein
VLHIDGGDPGGDINVRGDLAVPQRSPHPIELVGSSRSVSCPGDPQSSFPTTDSTALKIFRTSWWDSVTVSDASLLGGECGPVSAQPVNSNTPSAMNADARRSRSRVTSDWLPEVLLPMPGR